MKERERIRLDAIPKKWNKREEYEFLRVLTGYGVDLQIGAPVPTPDWSRFRAIAKLDRKSDEALSDYYKVFIAMCKRQANVRLAEEEKGLEGIIEDISEDHARLVLDRLELLSKLKEVGKTSINDERLLLCQNNLDTPDWWESGKHDRELIRAVMKHGLYQSQQNIFIDPEFSFAASERAYLEMLERQWMLAQEAEAAKLVIKAESIKSEPTPVAEIVKEPQVADTECVKTESEADKASAEVSDVAKDSEKAETAAESPVADASKEDTLVDVPKTQEEPAKADEKSEEKLKEQPNAETIPDVKSPQKDESQKEEAAINDSEPMDLKNNDEQSDAKLDEPSNEEPSPTDASSPKKADEPVESEANDANEEKAPETEQQEPEKEKEAIDDEQKSENDANNDVEMATEATEDESAEKESSEEVEKPASPQPNDASTESSVEKDAEKTDKEEIAVETSQPTIEDEKLDEPAAKSPKLQEETESEEVTPKPESVEDESEKPTNDVEMEEAKSPKATTTEKQDEVVANNEEPTPVVEEIKQEKEIEEKEQSTGANEAPKVEPMEDVKPISPVKIEEKKADDDNCVTIIDDDDDDDVMIIGKGDPDDDEVMHEKEKASIEKQNQQLAALLQSKKVKFENPVKVRWFRDFALEKRISHIVHCIEHSEWPVTKSYSAYAGCQGINLDVPLHETVKHMPPTIDLVGRSTPDLIAITPDMGGVKKLAMPVPAPPVLQQVPTPTPNLPYPKMQLPPIPPAAMAAATTSGSGKKRKRHIAIDVETERAKLHALLNSSQESLPGSGPQTPVQAKQISWALDDDQQPPQQKTPKQQRSNVMQPPPAHQHLSHLTRSNANQQQQQQLQQQQQAANYSTKPTLIPGTSSTLTPIDLSSSLTKPIKDLSHHSKGGPMDLSEVQDFSISKKQSNMSPFGSGSGGKGKLDDMLTKLMKKNNYVS